ncbi:MAG: hypothetical protein HRU13_12030 [Phycisphaerales bacterium]|nr:hypothetical protein [Phycisphaerales bacterium]
MLSSVGAYLTLLLLARWQLGMASDGKFLGVTFQQGIREGTIRIDYDAVNSYSRWAGTERAIGPDTRWVGYLDRVWFNPAIRDGLGVPTGIALLLTVGLFFVALWLWFNSRATQGAAIESSPEEEAP